MSNINMDTPGTLGSDRPGVELHLIDSERGDRGFDDYDVTGHATVYRVCIGNNLHKGDIFNVYGPPGSKRGAPWLGDLEKSLCAYLKVPNVRIAAEPEAAISVERPKGE